jgi:hypothetical protein
MVSSAPDPDALHQAVSEAAQRLIDALAAEAKLARRLLRRRQEHQLFQQWRAAQKLIEQEAGDYMQAAKRFRQAIQALFLKPQPAECRRPPSAT